MNKDNGPDKKKPHTEFSRQIGMKEDRKLRSQQESLRTIWSGLAMFGLIGWSISIPALLGIAVGLWVDRRFATEQSWTLILLIAGLFLGCLNAWRWVAKEDKAIRKGQGKKDE